MPAKKFKTRVSNNGNNETASNQILEIARNETLIVTNPCNNVRRIAETRKRKKKTLRSSPGRDINMFEMYYPKRERRLRLDDIFFTLRQGTLESVTVMRRFKIAPATGYNYPSSPTIVTGTFGFSPYIRECINK